jgi:hypothetical protein
MIKYLLSFILLCSSTFAQSNDVIWLSTNDSTVTTIKQGYAVVLLNKNNDVFLILLSNNPTSSNNRPTPKVPTFKYVDPNYIVKLVAPYLKEKAITKEQISILSHIYLNAKSTIDTVNARLLTNITKSQAQDILINATRDGFSDALPAWKPMLNQIVILLGQINSKIITSADLGECYGEIANGLEQALK